MKERNLETRKKQRTETHLMQLEIQKLLREFVYQNDFFKKGMDWLCASSI